MSPSKPSGASRRPAKRRLEKLQNPDKPVRRERAGAKKHRAKVSDQWQSYRSHHQQVALDSLRRLLRRPLATLMTTLVIAIAMVLPAGLYVGLNNVESVSQGWDGAARLSLFLKFSVDDRAAEELRARLANRDDIASAEYISPAAALEEFRDRSGFGEVLDQLDSNPLPGLIVLSPSPANSQPEQVNALRDALAELPEADLVKLDMEWLQRLGQITEISRRVTLALAIMLAAGVLLIVGNTIKLAIENRRDEILVVKLVGGTNAFVRRPFLYMGFWYGLFGGLLAWVMLVGCLLWLGGPVRQLAGLYGSDYTLLGLGIGDTLLMWFSASALGLLGAMLVVGRELRAIEPK
ncbi:permease-like cell division protein FtsX [Spongiibacter tropicus]|uniref:permease-like cell division protein FtsX n=1 Tax=Spongiibacter tropicus TaxID=454602 RepID=UPI0035BE6667